jgi:hypothetical protein
VLTVQGKSIRIVRKLVTAVLFALLFFLVGLFGGWGYHVYQISEVSLVRNSQYGYAEATFRCDMICDPLLYPFYWVAGRGQINGTFSIIYVPDAYTPSGRAYYGGKPEERYSDYILNMLTWATLPNLLVLFSLTVAIETVGKRSLYAVFLAGVVGFYASDVTGLVMGLTSACLAMLLLSRFWRNNPFERFWSSLWK